MFAINRLPPNGLLFLYDSYIRKLPRRLLASQVKHGNEKPLLAVHMKRINLIKMLFPSIHPPYISWFYLNQCNFFYELFSQLPFLKKGENQDEATASSCLVLPHASYGPENELKNHGFMLEIWLSVDHFLTQISASQESIKYSHNNILLPYSLPRVAWAGWFGQKKKTVQLII